MRNLAPRVMLFLGLAAGCLGQAVRVAPGISVAEAEYSDAVHAWSHADPDLAKDLLQAPADQIRERIRHVAALSDDAMAKKRSYLAEIVLRLQKAQKQITDHAPERIPADAIRRNLPEEQARIESQRDSVQTMLRELPPGSEYAGLRRGLEVERDRLEALHNDLAARYSALDSLDRAQRDVDFAETAGLAQQLAAVVQFWERERDDVERQRADRQEIYAAMQRAVDANAGIGTTAGGKAAAGKKKAQPTKKGKDQKRGAGPGG